MSGSNLMALLSEYKHIQNILPTVKQRLVKNERTNLNPLVTLNYGLIIIVLSKAYRVLAFMLALSFQSFTNG